MLLRAILWVLSVFVCCVCVINASSTGSNIKSGSSASRRRALGDADKAAQATEISSHQQPIEALELLQSQYAAPFAADPMATAASHHHKKGAKGWLDMGAWSKKKGAFGWYADYPVGKGRRR